MAQSRKYDYRVVQGTSGWSVEILRRASSKKTVITKSQDGFATEAEAQAWGDNEVKTFLKNLNLNEQNKRHSKQDE